MTFSTELSPRLLAEIEQAVATLLGRKINADPILGLASGIVSRLASVPKIHGSILQHTIEEVVSELPFVTVLAEQVIPITEFADRMADGKEYDLCLRASAPFSKRVVGKVKVDLVVINHVTGVATAYEIKRGHGKHDAGKQQKIRHDLIRVKLVLADHLRSMGHTVTSAEVRLVVYYGKETLEPIVSLSRESIDEHFQAPVTAMVERVAEVMRQKTHEILLIELRKLVQGLGDQLSGSGMTEAGDLAGLARLVTR